MSPSLPVEHSSGVAPVQVKEILIALAAHNFEPFTGLGIPFEHQDAGAANFPLQKFPGAIQQDDIHFTVEDSVQGNREGQQREGRKTCCFYQNGDVQIAARPGRSFSMRTEDISGNDGLIPRKESDDVIADFLQTQIHSPAVLS